MRCCVRTYVYTVSGQQYNEKMMPITVIYNRYSISDRCLLLQFNYVRKYAHTYIHTYTRVFFPLLQMYVHTYFPLTV